MTSQTTKVVTQVHQLSVAAAVEPAQECVEPDADQHSTEYQQHRVKSRKTGYPGDRIDEPLAGMLVGAIGLQPLLQELDQHRGHDQNPNRNHHPSEEG